MAPPVTPPSETPGATPRRGPWRRFVDAALIGQEDATALGMCRAAIVLVFTLSVLSHLGAVGEYFSDESVIFGEYARQAFHSRWSLFFYIREPWAVRLVYAVGVLAHVCWMLGLFTRISSALAWLLWISMVGRNPLLYSMPDQWHTALAFVLMLLPTGRGFSLDARWRGLGGTVPVWCRRLIQLQLAALYVNAAFAKTGDTWRVTGEAIYYAAASPYNRHFEINHWLAALQPYGLRTVTFAVWWWEYLFGLFVLLNWIEEVVGLRWRSPLRALYLGFGVLMHVGIQLLLYVAWFSPLTLAAYLAFLRPDEATRLRAWVARRLARQRGAKLKG